MRPPLSPVCIAERFGDGDLLAESVESMQAWVATELEAAGGAALWESAAIRGLARPRRTARNGRRSEDRPRIVATAYLYRSLELLAAAADAAGLAGVRDEAADRAQTSACGVHQRVHHAATGG